MKRAKLSVSCVCAMTFLSSTGPWWGLRPYKYRTLVRFWWRTAYGCERDGVALWVPCGPFRNFKFAKYRDSPNGSGAVACGVLPKLRSLELAINSCSYWDVAGRAIATGCAASPPQRDTHSGRAGGPSVSAVKLKKRWHRRAGTSTVLVSRFVLIGWN